MSLLSPQLGAFLAVVHGSPEWRFRKLEDILTSERIIDFDPSDQMTFSYLKPFKLFHLKMGSWRHFVNNNDALTYLFREGIGYGVLTREVVEPYLKRSELILLNQGKVIENTVALAWYPRPQMPGYFRALINAIH